MLGKILKIGALATVATLAFVEPSFADDCSQFGICSDSGAGLWDTAMKKTGTTFTYTRYIIFIIGGFGLVGLAFAAIFGKVHWKWAASLALGLFVVAVAKSIVEYAGGVTGGSGHMQTDTIS